MVNISTHQKGKGTASNELLAAVSCNAGGCKAAYVAGTEVKQTSGCMLGYTEVTCLTCDGATVDPEAVEETTKHPTCKAYNCKGPANFKATARALLGVIVAECCVTNDSRSNVGVCCAGSTDELTVVVTGVGSLTYELIGLTAADTGGGIIEAVASLSLGTAHLCSACAGGDKTDEVTTSHTCCYYNSSTGEMIVECTKKETGIVCVLVDGEGSLTDAKGCDSTQGALCEACTSEKQVVDVSVELAGQTAEVAKAVSEVMLLESVSDTVDKGTTSMGGGVSSCGSDVETCDYIGSLAMAVDDLSLRAVSGRGKASEYFKRTKGASELMSVQVGTFHRSVVGGAGRNPSVSLRRLVG